MMDQGAASGSGRGRSRFMRVVHVIGYLTTAIVIAEICLFAYFFADDIRRSRENSARRIEETRTREAPLAANYDWQQQRQVIATLPSRRALQGDGVRILVMPSLGPRHYGIALSLAPRATEAEGVLTVTDVTGETLSVRARRFTAPAGEYRRFVADLDTLTDGWPGDDDMCLDGTPVAFERVRGDRVTSGTGNCSDHYERLRQLTLTALRRLAPGPDLPTGDGWHEPWPEEGDRVAGDHKAGVSSNTLIASPAARGASTRR